MKKRRKSKARPSAARVRNVNEYHALPYAEHLRRQKAFKALSLMRTQGFSRTRAAKEAGISPGALQKIARNAISKSGSRYKAAASDRLLRVMIIPVPGSRAEVAVRSARIARLVSDYDNAVRHYVYTGDSSRLESFRGKSLKVGGTEIEFLTDLRQLDRLRRAGALSFESIYARVG